MKFHKCDYSLGLRPISDTDVHVLHDEISGTIVDETTGHVRIWEKRAQLLNKPLLSCLLKDNILLRPNDLEALVKDFCSILIAHECAELREFTRWDINQLVLVDITRDIAILSFVDDVWGCLGTWCNIWVYIRRLLQTCNVFLVTVVTDVRNIAGDGSWSLRYSLHGVFLVTWCQVSFVLLVLVVEKGWVIVLLHERSWRLVYLHIGHLFLCLAGLLLCSGFLFLFFLPLLLDALKLFKDVLIVEERVWEFFPENITTDKSFDSSLNYRHFEQLVNGGPLSWVPLQHHWEDIGNGRRKMRWQRCVVALDNFLGELMQRTCVEWWCQSCHLV